MQEIIASVDHIKFDLEIAVEQQLGAQPLPFPGMDSKRGMGGRRVRVVTYSHLGPSPWDPGPFPLGLGTSSTREPPSSDL